MACENIDCTTLACKCVEGVKFDIPTGYDEELGRCKDFNDIDCSDYEEEDTCPECGNDWDECDCDDCAECGLHMDFCECEDEED